LQQDNSKFELPRPGSVTKTQNQTQLLPV